MIFSSEPFACFRVELESGDLPLLRITDGRLMTEWATAVERDQTHSGAYVREMAASAAPVVGPLVCACLGGPAEGGGLALTPPFVVYDGWHRGAAWVLRGAADPIAARVVVTKRPPVPWRTG